MVVTVSPLTSCVIKDEIQKLSSMESVFAILALKIRIKLRQQKIADGNPYIGSKSRGKKNGIRHR